jgi:dTDP-glucose 4,6-dehydratase
MTLFIIGAAGFIGTNFVLNWVALSDKAIVKLDKLTHPGNLETPAWLQGDIGDIGDSAHLHKQS